MPWPLTSLKAKDFFLSVLSGLLYAFAFPPSNFSFLSWVALVPLFLCKTPSQKNPSRFFFHFQTGFLAGFTAHLVIFAWLWATFKAANIGFITTLGCWLMLAAIVGLYLAAFNGICSLYSNHWSQPIVAGAVWVCLDHVRSVALTGFPWALLAHTQASNKPFLQLAAITGASGLTFVLVAFNAALAGVRVGQRSWTPFAVVFAPVVCVHLWGSYRLDNKAKVPHLVSFRVAILQGNIDQYQKWDDLYETQIRERYGGLVGEALTHKPDLIVWPETAVPGWFPNEKFLLDWVKEVVTRSSVPHFVGAVTSRLKKDYNALFHITPDGAIRGEYDKQHMVPFGEYIPFGGFMRRWVPYLGELGEFHAGEGPKIFTIELPLTSPAAVKINFTPNICYEAIFPELIRQGVNRGAHVIVNVTNDGWFLTTGAPEQHYVTNIFRAVENGRPVIRAANTGISAAIDARGREIARSPLMEPGVIVADLQIDQELRRTFYGRFGPWFVHASWLAFGVLLIYCVYVARIKKSNRNPF